MKHIQLFRNFSTNNKKQTSSQFKSFFKLNIEDRPVSLAVKIRDTLKSNKSVKQFLHRFKYFFAISFIFFVAPGNQIPG